MHVEFPYYSHSLSLSDHVQVIASEDNTWVFVNGDIYPTCSALPLGGVCKIRGDSNGNYEIRTSSPALLIQLSTGENLFFDSEPLYNSLSFNGNCNIL